MRGDYSMRLLEFVLTGLGMSLVLAAFVGVAEPSEFVAWVVGIGGAVLAFACISHDAGWWRVTRPQLEPEDWRERHRRWEEENKHRHGNATDGS